MQLLLWSIPASLSGVKRPVCCVSPGKICHKASIHVLGIQMINCTFMYQNECHFEPGTFLHVTYEHSFVFRIFQSILSFESLTKSCHCSECHFMVGEALLSRCHRYLVLCRDSPVSASVAVTDVMAINRTSAVTHKYLYREIRFLSQVTPFFLFHNWH